MCSRPSSRRIDDGPVTGSMTCRGSPTLNCAGFHLNTCSTRSRSATWTSSPMITSFVRNTRPYRSRIASRVSSGRMTPRTVCARRGRRGPGTSEADLMRAELTRARADGREDPLLAAGQRVQLLERLGFEQGPARLLARAADLGADRAVPVVRGVLRALLRAARARADAGLQ